MVKSDGVNQMNIVVFHYIHLINTIGISLKSSGYSTFNKGISIRKVTFEIKSSHFHMIYFTLSNPTLQFNSTCLAFLPFSLCHNYHTKPHSREGIWCKILISSEYLQNYLIIWPLKLPASLCSPSETLRTKLNRFKSFFIRDKKRCLETKAMERDIITFNFSSSKTWKSACCLCWVSIYYNFNNVVVYRFSPS